MLNRTLTTNTLDAPEREHEQHEQGFDLREVLSFAWRQWKLIGSVVGVTLVVAAVYILKEVPLYTATAQVLLEVPKEKAAGTDSVLTEISLLDAGLIESQLAIIKSTVFLQRVVQKANIVSDPEFGFASPQTSSVISTVRANTESAGEAKPRSSSSDGAVIPPDVVAAIEGLKGATSVKREGQGYILSISFTSVDPARAAKLANAIADGYVVEKLDARFDAAKRASAWLSDRLVELRVQLRDSEEAVAKFRAENGLLQSGANVTLTQQQLSELNAKLVAAKSELAEKKARVDLLRSIEEKGGSIQSMPDLPNSNAVAALRQQEAAISQKEADLVARYNDRHPLVVNIRAERRDVQRAIAAETQRLGANIRNDYELARARVEAMTRTFQEVTGQTTADSRTAITLRELERTAAVNKSLFEDFLQKSKIAQEQSTFEAREARVISPALPPGGPSYPRKGQFMMVALVLGLLMGVGGAVAKEKLNTGFTTPYQAEEMLGIPVLTSVSLMDSRELTVNGKFIRIPFYPAAMPLSRFSEAMRTLRSGIQMTDVDDPPKVIQMTSTVPSEGKTTIALSLATSAAGSGLKVLFIDADLRRASASRFLGQHKAPGLVDMLLGGVDPQDAIKYVEESKIWTLPTGSKTQNPADILGSERMKSFVERCRRSFDLIVIDTPPIGPVVDPIVVSNLVDKVVYVVRWASTARELVQQSVQRFPGNRKLAGIVFNMVNDKLAKKYGKYAYGYYYGSRDYKKYYSG